MRKLTQIFVLFAAFAAVAGAAAPPAPQCVPVHTCPFVR